MTYSAKSRRDQILQLAETSGLASVEELSRLFEVTASTIRRDLALLDHQGKVARTYGGAMAVSAHPESSLRQRATVGHAQKTAIAQWCAAEVQRGEALLLDGGSTVGALAHELRDAADLRVTTIGINTLEALADSPGIQLDSLGGRLRRLSNSFVGPLTEAALERTTFDRVFLGADAVTAEDGICEAEHEQTRLKQLMAARGGHVYVLADASKLGRRPFHAWAKLPAPWTLVTDDRADPDEIAKFRAVGVTVQVAAVG
jgi:DeoR/GlpR family transcriptional regulator of sugar metabolism